MLIQKEADVQNNLNQNNDINQEEMNNNLNEINNNQNNLYNPIRGFDIFLLHGLSSNEVRTLRLLFHLSAYQQSILTGVPLDWSAEGIYHREESWLLNQLRAPNRNEENENYLTLYVNEGGLLFRNRNSSENNMIYIFLLGFFIGFITNISGILILFCRFKPMFKVGLLFGMITSGLFLSKIFHLK